MKKEKLNLEKFKVDSFVTNLEGQNSETVKGGFTITTLVYSDITNCFPSDEQTGCTGVCCGTLTSQGASGAYGPVCQSDYPNCGPLHDY